MKAVHIFDSLSKEIHLFNEIKKFILQKPNASIKSVPENTNIPVDFIPCYPQQIPIGSFSQLWRF
jgi:hypothetical protein